MMLWILRKGFPQLAKRGSTRGPGLLVRRVAPLAACDKGRTQFRGRVVVVDVVCRWLRWSRMFAVVASEHRVLLLNLCETRLCIV